jgi:hypothetical protein
VKGADRVSQSPAAAAQNIDLAVGCLASELLLDLAHISGMYTSAVKTISFDRLCAGTCSAICNPIELLLFFLVSLA